MLHIPPDIETLLVVWRNLTLRFILPAETQYDWLKYKTVSSIATRWTVLLSLSYSGTIQTWFCYSTHDVSTIALQYLYTNTILFICKCINFYEIRELIRECTSIVIKLAKTERTNSQLVWKSKPSLGNFIFWRFIYSERPENVQTIG